MDDDELTPNPEDGSEDASSGSPLPEDSPGIYDNEDANHGRAFRAGKALGQGRKRLVDLRAAELAKQRAALGEAEQAHADNPASMFPMEEDWFKGIDNAKGFSGTTKVIARGLMSRRGALGLGLGGGVVAILIALFFALLPLKINMIMENLQNKYFSGNDSAVERRMDTMFNKYVKDRLLPALAKPGCTSTRTLDKGCVAVSPGDSPFDRLANAWRDARLENKMATDYGIELSREPGSSSFTIKINDKVASNIDVEGFRKNPASNLWQAEGVNRTEARRMVSEALQNETKYKKLFYRLRVGELLERKYGIRRCLFFCQKRDKFQDDIAARATALKIATADRVLSVRSKSLGLAMTCVLDSACLNDPPNRDGNKPGDLERKDTLQKNLQKYLDQRGVSLTSEALQQLVTQVDDITQAGSFGKYLAIQIAEQVAGETGKQLATDGLPVIGWINAAATLINKAATTGPKLKKFSYVLAATAAVSYFVTYRTYADEQKGGYTDPQVAKSMAEGLGDTSGDATHKGQTAEASPMYGALFGASSSQTALSKLFPSAYAASAAYTCDNNQPVPAGKLACPEESFVSENVATDVSDAFNEPGLSALKGVAGVWTGTVGKITGLFGSAASKVLSTIPGYDALQQKVGEWSGELMNSLGKKVFKSAVSDTMSGGRSFQVLAAGADAAAGASGEFGIGGQLLTQDQSNQLLAAQESEENDSFSHQSFFARMFDTSSPQSLVSQVAMSMPISTSTTTDQFATSLVRNPFALISDSFATLFTRRAHAATALPNPFGVLRYGYPVDDSSITVDPDTLTKSYCSAFNKQWADNVTTDPATGMEVHKTTNPCLLDSAVLSAGGGLFSDDALKDDFADVPPPEAEETVNTYNPSTLIAGDTYATTKCEAGTDVSPPGGSDGYAAGKLYKIRLCKVQGIVVNAVVSKQVDALLNAAHAAGIPLSGGGYRDMASQIAARKRNGCPADNTAPSSACRVPTARPGWSNHQMGLAIDFNNCSSHGTACFIWLNANAAQFGFKNFPKEPWHWSPDGK